MLKKIFFTVSFLILLNLSVVAQKKIIREEYLKITPYVSTLEDITKVYGEGHNIIKGRENYLNITYTISDNIEIEIDFFRSCHQTDIPENERTWIVESLFFTFDEDLKLKPKNIFLNKKDFTGCPYGDVVGQIIYFNKDKNIQFTYMKLTNAVTDLDIMATEENKERYKCKKDKVIFTLDPNSFRCGSPD